MPGNKTDRQAGFTLVEAITSIAIFSIIAVSVWAGVASGIRVIGRVAAEVRTNAGLVFLDDLVRASAGRIVVPFWEAGIRVGSGSLEESDGELPIPWYGGKKDGTLLIRRRNGALEIEAGGVRYSVAAPVKEIRFISSVGDVVGTGGMASGLLVTSGTGTAGTASGGQVRVSASFGGIPLYPAGEPAGD